jgi:hypothetical protein
MEKLENFADKRENGRCLYCGDAPCAREHVPPKIFLDVPYPANLFVVESCVNCNQSFSLDEQYMACLLDCVISGTTNPNAVQREIVKRTLTTIPALQQRLQEAKIVTDDEIYFRAEHERINSVVKKIAMGHVLYELNLIMQADGAEMFTSPLLLLNDPNEFEDIETIQSNLWPEIGSRTMQRVVRNLGYRWIEVQPGRYRYAVIQADAVEVRMVFSEYLACIVRWLD